MKFIIAFLAIMFSTSTVIARSTQPASLTNVSISKEKINNLNVYNFYLKTTDSEIKELHIGSDCENWQIPRGMLEKGDFKSNLGPNWTTDFVDDDEASSPEIAIAIMRAGSSKVYLPTGETKILEIKTIKNIDDKVFEKSFCARSVDDKVTGVATNKSFIQVDEDLDSDKITKSCKSKYEAMFNTSSLNSSASVLCNNKSIEFETSRTKLVEVCTKLGITEYRRDNVEKSKEIVLLMRAAAANTRDKSARDLLLEAVQHSRIGLTAEYEKIKRGQGDLEQDFQRYKQILQNNCEGEQTRISIDVKPGRCSDPVAKRDNDTIRVAVIGSSGFNPALVDLKSWSLDGASAINASIEDIGKVYDCTNQKDGFKDLVLSFKTKDILGLRGANRDVDSTDHLILIGRPAKGKAGDQFVGGGDFTFIKK